MTTNVNAVGLASLFPVVHTIEVSVTDWIVHVTPSITTETYDDNVPNPEPVIVISVPPIGLAYLGEIFVTRGVSADW